MKKKRKKHSSSSNGSLSKKRDRHGKQRDEKDAKDGDVHSPMEVASMILCKYPGMKSDLGQVW